MGGGGVWIDCVRLGRLEGEGGREGDGGGEVRD